MESKLGDNLNTNNAIAQSLGTGANGANNDIFLPKNSLPSIPQPTAQAPESGQVVNATVPVQPADTNLALSNITPSTNNFFTLFGYDVPKKTIYLIVGFIILIAVYMYYNKMAKSKAAEEEKTKEKEKEKEKDKKKEKSDDKKSKKKSKSKDSSESSD